MTTQKVARNPVSKGRSPMPRCKGRSVSSPRLRRHPKSSAVLAHDHRTPRHAVREQLDGLRHGHHDHPGGAPPPHPRGPRRQAQRLSRRRCPRPVRCPRRTREHGRRLRRVVTFQGPHTTAGLAPQEPLPFGNASCPSPGHPVTLSAFGQLAPSEVRQAAKQQSAVERQSHMYRVRQALAFVAPLVGAFALYKVVSGGGGSAAAAWPWAAYWLRCFLIAIYEHAAQTCLARATA